MLPFLAVEEPLYFWWSPFEAPNRHYRCQAFLCFYKSLSIIFILHKNAGNLIETMCMICLQMIAASIFALCMWLRFEQGLQEWIEKLELSPFYIGVYVLVIASAVMMIISFIGCVAALQENNVTILIVSRKRH